MTENHSRKGNKKKFHVLFVCTGNSCRSPMAEGILKSLLPPEYRDKIKISSAGTGDFWGMPASDLAIEISEEHGIDISGHRSRGLTRGLMEKANLVLVMAKDHEEFIRFHYPAFRDNVFLLKKFDRNKNILRRVNIEDPIGQGKEIYQKVFDEIYREIERILPRILQLADDYLQGHSNQKLRDEGND